MFAVVEWVFWGGVAVLVLRVQSLCRACAVPGVVAVRSCCVVCLGECKIEMHWNS